MTISEAVLDKSYANGELGRNYYLCFVASIDVDGGDSSPVNVEYISCVYFFCISRSYNAVPKSN